MQTKGPPGPGSWGLSPRELRSILVGAGVCPWGSGTVPVCPGSARVSHQRLWEGRGHGELRSQERNGARWPQGFGRTRSSVKAGVLCCKGFPTAPKSTGGALPVLQLMLQPQFSPRRTRLACTSRGTSPGGGRGLGAGRDLLLTSAGSGLPTRHRNEPETALCLAGRKTIPEGWPGTWLRCAGGQGVPGCHRLPLGCCSLRPHHPRHRCWLRPGKLAAPLGHQGWDGTLQDVSHFSPLPSPSHKCFSLWMLQEQRVQDAQKRLGAHPG